MSDVVKTLKIKKAGTPGNVPPPDTVPNAVPVAEGYPSEQPAQGHATLPRYAQVQTSGPVVKDSRQWTAWAIVAMIAVLAMLALLVFQLLELKFYADHPPVWTHPGMF
jgi:hypothetical protein